MTVPSASSSVTTTERTIAVWQERIRFRVLSKGSGPALVFFHGPWGLTWDPFLDTLARDFTVHAPEHPGTTPGAPDDIYQLDGLWDLVLCYDDLLEALGLEQAVLVGHSFGAMVACEVAASSPRRARRLALIAPIGFWRDAEPVVNWMALEPAEMRRRIFRDPDGEPARRLFGESVGHGGPATHRRASGATDPQTAVGHGGPATQDPQTPIDDKAAAAARVRLAWAMGATGKFIWPIPDKGLKKRIHRIKAPALLLWGKDDRLVPPIYADEFTQRLPGARLQTVDHTSHAPHLEQPDAVARMVRDFAR